VLKKINCRLKGCRYLTGFMKWQKGRFLYLFMAICFVLLSGNDLFAEEKLKAGKWKGTYIIHDGRKYKIECIVSYVDDPDNEKLQIKMINIDLDLTYILTDIKLSEEGLAFKIPKEFETKECILKKKEGSYTGNCISDMSTEDEPSEITMKPPLDDAGDTAAESSEDVRQ